MVIIFVLLVFVLSQAFLSVALTGREQALDKVNHQLAQLTEALSLERGKATSLELSVSQLNQQLAAGSAARDRLSQQLAALRDQAQQTAAARDALQAERDRLTNQLAQAQQAVQTTAAARDTLQAERDRLTQQLAQSQQAATAAASQLQAQLGAATDRATATQQERDALAAQLAEARQLLAAAQARYAEMQKQIADLDKTVKADKATIDARVSDLAKLAEQARALAALRDELEKQAQDAAVRATTEQQRREAVAAQLADEQKLGDSARAQIALLTQQVDQLKAQLASVAQALDLAQTDNKGKEAEIANLGQKLNVALAQRVEELQQYRSEFFGKLRTLLANRPGIQVVGDRFVFQSEVLFPVGSADLTQTGVAQMTTLAITIKDIAQQIPPDVKWILRVDGHTDPQPVKGGQFASNWELAAARAITVVKLLIADGVPADHLAATAFGEFQPFGPGDTPDAYAKDRRIELRLTDR
ncbi:MAG: peptidoglycan -binding protein [Rhodospirillales bacterium]|nr:peptidoglycan -binding protein [Rhodospirillales bacterium]